MLSLFVPDIRDVATAERQIFGNLAFKLLIAVIADQNLHGDLIAVPEGMRRDGKARAKLKVACRLTPGNLSLALFSAGRSARHQEKYK
jgi:hypothetical protein